MLPLTPNCIASRIFRSCAARRIRRSWSSARRALGYAALALTDECSFSGIVRAHVAAKSAGLPLVIGSEVTLADGMKLVLLATDRASYGDLSQLITRGRRSARERQLRADARRCRGVRGPPPRALGAARSEIGADTASTPISRR